MAHDRCQELVRRTPQVIHERYGLGGPQDYSHLQVCGRLVAEDGLCAVHVRRRDATPDRPLRFGKQRAWMGKLWG